MNRKNIDNHETACSGAEDRELSMLDDYILDSDNYFKYDGGSKFPSEYTANKIKTSLPRSELFKTLSSLKIPQCHSQKISKLFNMYKNLSAKWIHIMNEGFNILLNGVGSKRNLLHHFYNNVLVNQPAIIVNGFFPHVSVKDILDRIIVDILELSPITESFEAVINAIESEFKMLPELHLYLIIHNIDGVMFRSSKAQDMLSRLASIQNIHILASIDHVNIALLWDSSKLRNFNFTWWDVTTMLPYKEEILFENSLLVQDINEAEFMSIRNVYNSLTSNAQCIFRKIAKHQLENNDLGVSFKDLYYHCRENFLVSSDLALRAHLTEFLDHKLVKIKRAVDGTERLLIPTKNDLLRQFIEQIS